MFIHIEDVRKTEVEKARPYQRGPYVLYIREKGSLVLADLTAEHLRELADQIKEALASGQSENL